ncbi:MULTISPECIES: hypothetical protein [Rhizobium/Agrobacterium group]|uniref:Lipoprotein n=2 Tax=Agrobacterium tumefaciens complex TaxID=1183400 RepID=A0AAE6EM45_AGRTU|nr:MULTISPECIES: hypothetical protein [Rhizobium/Agrobacterium group]MCA2376859.1 hypothetical protein [Agrobacterium tomkonis RTP8]KNY33136.1 hypothetical protein AKG12_15225 [Agrobacterium sp. SUL3]KRA68771.1 hypothetical protein ASD85_01185 [Rhizobium sp. Root651]MBP8937574.1 hypothetical protein [Agrobacterium sp.]MCA2371996.1 hypothetical protein [Agrobacterium tomkonis CIP 111-78]
MKRISIFILLAAGSIVSGCSSTEQTAENMAAQRERCRVFGYPEGSRDFADCMMKLSMQQSDLRQQTFDTIWSSAGSHDPIIINNRK